MMNGVQYLTNSQGSKTHVLITIKDWHQLADYVEEIRYLEELSKSIKQGIREAKDMEAGLIKKSSTKEFLDAL
ncbi:MAG: hypothetical protein AAF849_16085 [Bacteroidota bacterium]